MKRFFHHKSKSFKLISLVVILLLISMGSYYLYFHSMGSEARYEPDEGYASLKVSEISDELNKEYNVRRSALYATSYLEVSAEDFEALNNFEDYMAYAKEHQETYSPEFFYLEDPKVEDIRWVHRPIAYNGQNIEITQRMVNEISESYGIDGSKVTTSHLLLTSNAAEIAFQPSVPNLKISWVELEYEGKQIGTPMWLPVDANKGDIDFIFMSKANAVALFEGKILSDISTEHGFYTYKDRGFGFKTINPNIQMYNGFVASELAGTRYSAIANDPHAVIGIGSSVLYIVIKNEETHEEKVFSQRFTNGEFREDGAKDFKDLIGLITDDWQGSKE